MLPCIMNGYNTVVDIYEDGAPSNLHCFSKWPMSVPSDCMNELGIQTGLKLISTSRSSVIR